MGLSHIVLGSLSVNFYDADKSFDENSGNLTYTAKNETIKIQVNVKPTSSCSIEKIEGKKMVTKEETVTRYKLIGGCDPILMIYSDGGKELRKSPEENPQNTDGEKNATETI